MAIPQAEWDWLGDGPLGAETRDELLRENRALRSYVRAAVERDPSAGQDSAILARSTDFFLYPLGCAPGQLRRIGSGPAALPPAAIVAQKERCRRLRAGMPLGGAR
jgi:hypothetical protein